MNKDLKNILDIVNQDAPQGTFHFLAGYGNYTHPAYHPGRSRLDYSTHFIPSMTWFFKPPIPERVTYNYGIQSRYKYNKKSAKITWDSFIKDAEVKRWRWKNYCHKSMKNRLGLLIMEDPFQRPDLWVKNDMVLHNKGLDLADLVLLYLGICPKQNPNLKRITGLELAKHISKDMPVHNYNDKIIVSTTAGFFDKMIRKASDWIKHVGRKIEKEVTTPLRNYLKRQAPKVWDAIDYMDKKIGVTKHLKHWHNELDKVVRKYGGTVMNYAVVAIASAYGVPPMATKALIAVADNLSRKEKKVLKQVTEKAGSINKSDKQLANKALFNILSNVKKKMVTEKGKEGENDFTNLIEAANKYMGQIKERKQETEKVVAGFQVNPVPLFRYYDTLLCPRFMNCRTFGFGE